MHLTPGSRTCQWLPRDTPDLGFLVGTVSLDMVEAFAFEALLDGLAALAIVKTEAVGTWNRHLEASAWFILCVAYRVDLGLDLINHLRVLAVAFGGSTGRRAICGVRSLSCC